MAIPYISTSCLKEIYPLSKKLELFEQWKIQNVEIGVSNDSSIDFSKIIKKFNFNYIIHHYFPPPKEPFVINLASESPIIRHKSVNQLINSIEFCANHQISLFSFHAGFRADPDINFHFNRNNIQKYQDAFQHFVDSVVTIVEFAETRNVNIAIENNVISEYNLIQGKNELLLMCEYREFQDLFKHINSKNLGILLDLGHLKVTSKTQNFNPNNFIDAIRSNIFMIHLSNNDGKIDQHKCFKRGDWIANLIKNKCADLNIPLVLECKCGNPEKIDEMFSIINLR
jgi:sugar phosphate isomerase/epimerase